MSVLLLGLERCSGIFRNLCRGILHNLRRGILNGLYRPDLCLLIFLGRPRLELPKQAFTIFRRVLTVGFRGGSIFLAGQHFLCGRRQSLNIGAGLNCWHRLIGVRLERRFVGERSRDGPQWKP